MFSKTKMKKAENDVKELTIKLNPNGLDAVVSFDKGGITNTKVVSIDELASTLASTHKLCTGIIPKGTRYYAGDAKNFTICLETAPRIKGIALDTFLKRQEAEDKHKKFVPEIVNIPFPACLFVFHIKNGKLALAKAASLKQTIISEKDSICRFPFGNTNTNAVICWGNNPLPPIKTPTDTVVLMSLFLDSAFNGELVDTNTFKHIKFNDVLIEDVFGLIRILKCEPKFPEALLCEINQTFSQFIKGE